MNKPNYLPKTLAPEVQRQRLLIEGFYSNELMNPEVIKDYFQTILNSLHLKAYGEPIIFSPGSDGKAENQGYDAFIPLIDSGISLYVWTQKKFFSIIIYTCKEFSEEKALEKTKDFFGAGTCEWMNF